MSFKKRSKLLMGGEKNIQISARISELTTKFNIFFPIHSEEDGEIFLSLRKREFRLPKFFDNDVLYDIRLDKDIQLWCDQMGWTKFVTLKYDTFYELTIEFYTTFKIIDKKEQIYSCRFIGKEYKFDHAIMFEIFRFLERGYTHPPNDFSAKGFVGYHTE